MDKYSDKNIARSAFKVTVGNVLNLLTGVGSQVLIAAYFGAGAEMDAFLTALVVPTYLQAVLLGGLSFVFIPEFVRASMEDRSEKAWGLVGTFFWMTLGVLTLVALGGSLLVSQILQVSAPGLSPEKSMLASGMLEIMMISVPFVGIATLSGGVQNAQNKFFWPAFAPAVGSIGSLLTILYLYQRSGPIALAWGFLVSSVLLAIVNVTPILLHGWKNVIPLWDKRVLDLLKLLTPFILFGLITRSPEVFERFFASGLPDGDLSYLGYARKIAKSFGLMLRSGVLIAIFPAMAAAYVNRGNEGLVDKTEFGIKVTLAIALPAFAILSAAALPLVMVLYERGEFTHNVALNVSQILPILAFREVCITMLGNVFVRGFYVTKDTHTAPIVSTISSGFYIVVAGFLTGIGGYVGLTVASLLSGVVGTTTLGILLTRKLNSFRINRLVKDTLNYAIVSFFAFLAAFIVSTALVRSSALIRLFFSGGAGVITYLIMLNRLDPGISLSVLELSGAGRLVEYIRIGRLRKVSTAE